MAFPPLNFPVLFSTTSNSMLVCLNDLVRVPRGPFTVTLRALIETVTSSGNWRYEYELTDFIILQLFMSNWLKDGWIDIALFVNRYLREEMSIRVLDRGVGRTCAGLF